MAQLAEAPRSALFTVKESPGAGRGVFAACDIPPGTLILTADDLTVHALFREYRGEVCWNCFIYDCGKKLSFRDPVHGFAFCSAECASDWKHGQDDVSLRAWTAVGKVLHEKGNRGESNGVLDVNKPGPTASDIAKAWTSAEREAALILKARSGGLGTTKHHQKALLRALCNAPSSDIIRFQLSAIVTRHLTPEKWPAILALAQDPLPYRSAQDLESHVKSYLHLVAILPEQLLPLVTPETLYTIETREMHNCFGIRSLEDEGSEFFGYGVWPSASCFNHSCEPNVAKRRTGRTWTFTARGNIERGTELCISYLGGDEESMSCSERRSRLKNNWGFDCACGRCNSEKGQPVSS